MTRQDYIEFILDHYHNPHHKGSLADPDILVNGGNPGCGDIVNIFVKVDENDRITDASFEGQGCTISMAASSLLMDKIIGKTISEVDAMDYNELIQELGEEVVQARIRCATLALDTIKAGAREYPSHKATGKKLLQPILLAETFRGDGETG
ncbi:MAG TPA: SUF system NifU family Fe-S cluster assembly protein [Anaerolineae bacterium]|nr:SUF system NifU family Fe-S cluster assembly protein [Anaerolineae bacterium]